MAYLTRTEEVSYAVILQSEMMGSPVELLLRTLEDLGEDELKSFQWILQQAEALGGFPAIPKRRLEKADRPDTVDQMVQTYNGNTLEVTMKVLHKISRNDLVQHLANSSSGPKCMYSIMGSCESKKHMSLDQK